MLFEGQFLLSPATTPNYDVSPDGQGQNRDDMVETFGDSSLAR